MPLLSASGVISKPAVITFNPITSIPWSHLWYPGGPEFLALGLANGAVVTTWPDEASTLDATGAGTARPTYMATGLNGKKCLDFDGSNDHVETISRGSQLGPPTSLIVVADIDVVGSSINIIDQPGSIGGRYTIQGCPYLSGAWGMFCGAQATGTAASTGIKAFRAFNTTSTTDTMTVNGTTVITGNAGVFGFTALSLGVTQADNVFNGRYAFIGVYSGDITAHARWAGLQGWVLSEYGVALS